MSNKRTYALNPMKIDRRDTSEALSNVSVHGHETNQTDDQLYLNRNTSGFERDGNVQVQR